MYSNVSVDEIAADIMEGQRCLTVENAVDEYLLAEDDILKEATTAADKMVDLSIEAGYDDESQYLEDDEEINALLDEEIDDYIGDEDELFDDTIGEYADEDEFIEDVEDVVDVEDDLDSLLDEDDIDSLISDTEYDY